MFKRNKLYTAVVTSALMTCSAMSIAQQEVTTTASVEVSDAFALTNTQVLDFGTLSVIQNLDIGNSGTPTTVNTAPELTIYSDGTAPELTIDADFVDNDKGFGTIAVLIPGAPASFAVSDAARFTDLDIYFETGTNTDQDFKLTNPSADTNANSDFDANVATTDITLTGGANSGTYDASTNPLRTDGNGTASFAVGATISPNPLATQIFNGTYTGTFTVIVQY